MKKTSLTQRKTLLKRSSGQTLVLAVIIFIVILLAICLIFDVQSIMHGKIKSQSAADAAAIEGANWQMNTLNVIGELNLVKASTVLISEPLWGVNAVPEEFTLVPDASSFANAKAVDVSKLKKALEKVEAEKARLRTADRLVSQMQTRLSFVGPLIGFGAAQIAAKKNGAQPNEEAGIFFKSMCEMMNDGGVYSNNNVAPQVINDYAWRRPYRDMLSAIVYGGTSSEGGTPQGIAAVPVINGLGVPQISVGNNADGVSNRQILEYALSRYWCGLRDVIDAGGLDDGWWHDADYSVNSNFIGQSEILPVYVAFTGSTSPYYAADNAGALDDRIAKRFDGYAVSMADTYDEYDPYPYTCDESGNVTSITLHFKDENGGTTEEVVGSGVSTYPVPEGCTFISNPDDGDFRYNVIPELSWCIFDASYWQAMDDGTKSDWEKYLDKSFQAGKDYRYGGSAYFEIREQAGTVTGRFGDVPDVTVTASAKPFGVLDVDGKQPYPFAASMVLPVFTDTALVPVALETPEGYNPCDLGFMYYVTEFLPLLMDGDGTGKFNSISEAEKSFVENHYSHYYAASRYIRAAALLSDPAFIAEGKEYLDTPVSTVTIDGTKITKRRRDFCGHGRGTGRGYGGSDRTRSGPGSLH